MKILTMLNLEFLIDGRLFLRGVRVISIALVENSVIVSTSIKTCSSINFNPIMISLFFKVFGTDTFTFSSFINNKVVSSSFGEINNVRIGGLKQEGGIVLKRFLQILESG